MSSGSFVKVFDILDSGYRSWSFLAVGLIFVAIGLIIFFAPQFVKKFGWTYMEFNSTWKKAFRYYLLGFAVLWTSASFFVTYSAYSRHHGVAVQNECKIVEGPVTNFVPMPKEGHSMESFSVRGVKFSYSDYVLTDGFNNTESHGGPIHADSYVRICYDPTDNVILRLEIRDYTGPLKDFSKIQNFFPKPEDVQKMQAPIPIAKLSFYGNLIFILYLLDLSAFLALFVPYLNTYIRLKKSPVGNVGISHAIESGKKVKLRNMILYWDRERRAIWLRPRGLNLLQVQLTAAKLNTDEAGSTIQSQEIRFSSGYPLIMILVIWAAYQLFSATYRADSAGPSAGQFAAIAAGMFFVLNVINSRIVISRMEKLIQDSLKQIDAAHQ